MGRVKIAKKSTFIDMTAMSDVTVLLLTFFMLTSTFLQKEPVTVITPASISDEKVRETNVAQVLVSPQGEIWISMFNDAGKDQDKTQNNKTTTEESDTVKWSNDEMRAALLQKVSEEYNKYHPREDQQIHFTNEQKIAFSKLTTFGVPLKEMGEFLDLYYEPEGLTKMDQWLAGELEGHTTGIPITWNRDENHPNEFQLWIKALRQTENKNLATTIKSGTGIAIKADENTSFDVIRMVMENLQTIRQNKFTLLTALKAEE